MTANRTATAANRRDHNPATRTSRRTPLRRGVRRRALVGWLFVLPALLMYAVFVLQPLVLTIQYSLYRWNGVGPATWVGLSNYLTVLRDPDLLGTIVNSFKLVLFFSIVPVSMGLVTASVIHRVATGRLGSVTRTVLFLPQVIPLVAAGIIWGWLLSLPGLINQALTAVGLGGLTRAWLGDFDTALPGRRPHRHLGPARILHRAASGRHDKDRPGAVRVREDRRSELVPGVRRRSRCRACGTRSAYA